MILSGLFNLSGRTQKYRSFWQLKSLSKSKLLLPVNQLVICLLVLVTCLALWTAPASANIDDDRYEGNIYILYGGNGSLVPPRMDLATSLKREKPAILVFYIDDSSDCKQFSIVVTRLQEFYGRAASIIPISVDSLVDKEYSPEEPGYYYSGVVPETVILDQQGKVVYDGKGQVPYEEMDDVLREVFDLLPRSESQVLKRRSFNEYNSGMTSE
ncbi:MAG: thylakoid membrane photosystem I accumulation factor [Cyanobacteria bacterium P01_G01_bin.39]